MNGRRTYLFAALAIALTWASACACKAEDIYSPQAPLKVLDLVPNAQWEKEKENARAGKYYEKAQELKKSGKYIDATYFFNLALQLEPEFKTDVAWEQAEIFDSLGRKADADRLMKSVVAIKHNDFWTAEKYARFLIRERRGKEALAVCRKIPRLLEQENGVLLLAECLMASGQKHDAIELAKRNYTRMARQGTSFGTIKAFLEKNGAKCELTLDSSHNQDVLRIVRNISSLKKPLTHAQLATIFPRRERERNWLGSGPGVASAGMDGGPWQLRRDEEEPNWSRIRINPDLLTTAISRVEVEKIFGKTKLIKGWWGMHGSGISDHLDYFQRDPQIRFLLSGPKGFFRIPRDDDQFQRVTQIQIAWKCGVIPKPPPPPQAPPKLVPTEEIEKHISEAEDAYLKGDYRRAVTLLMKYWQEEGIRTDRIGFKRYSRRKKVLQDCYRKLGQKEIAAYIEMADCMSLAADVDQAFGNRTLLLPTIDEYMRRPWKVQDGGADGQMSFSGIWPITTVDKNTPHYKEFYKAVGPFNGHVEIEILPLPASLIDPAIFEPGALD